MESVESNTQWTMMFASSAAGLLVLAVWWMCGRSSRVANLKRVIEAEEQTLFTFLADPHILKAIHPYTTDIRVEEESEVEERGTFHKKFVWVEKVPVTVESHVRMHCYPGSSTIIMDILPAGGKFKVELNWRFQRADDSTESIARPRHGLDSPHPQQEHVKSGHGTETSHTDPDPDPDPDSGDTPEKGVTEFHNRILVTGPRALVFLVMSLTLKSVQTTLMDRVQAHFKDLKQQK